MALNRGERLKVLSIKVVPHDDLHREVKRFFDNNFLRKGRYDARREKMLIAAFEEAFKRSSKEN